MAEELKAAKSAAFTFFPISLVVIEILNKSVLHEVNFKKPHSIKGAASQLPKLRGNHADR